jgi:hypothetical protein
MDYFQGIDWLMRTKLFCRTVIADGIVSLFGCGGGDSNTASAPTTAAPSTTISGTAASGAPFAGATVTLTDANGTQRSATAASDGRFTLDASGLTAPFALNATGTVSDAPTTLIAVSAEGPEEGERKTLNVTPLTTAVAALLSDNNDPLDLTDPAKLKAKATPAQIQAIVAALRSILGEVVASTGASASTFDPMTTAFNADRTGLDAVLDAIKVSLSDRGVELTNAFIPIPENGSDLTGTASPTVVLTKADLANPPAPLAAPTVSIATITALIDTWRDEINACFAQPAANRVTLDGNGVVTGLQGACAQVRGFDPSYKSNGFTLLQRFGSLLSDPEMDGAKFAWPEVLTLVKTDTGQVHAVFRVFYQRRDGNTNHLLDVAQKIATVSASDSGWRVDGNQRDYDAAVEARVARIVALRPGGKEEYRSGLRLYFNPGGPNASDVTDGKSHRAGLAGRRRRAWQIERLRYRELSVDPEQNRDAQCFRHQRGNRGRFLLRCGIRRQRVLYLARLAGKLERRTAGGFLGLAATHGLQVRGISERDRQESGILYPRNDRADCAGACESAALERFERSRERVS